jgi:hypothetical protein
MRARYNDKQTYIDNNNASNTILVALKQANKSKFRINSNDNQSQELIIYMLTIRLPFQ